MESSHRWTFVRYFGTQHVPIGMPGRTDGLDGDYMLQRNNSGSIISIWLLHIIHLKCSDIRSNTTFMVKLDRVAQHLIKCQLQQIQHVKSI